MSEIRRIGSQLRRAYYGKAWHGPSVREALAGVTARQAARRPVDGAHTIWEITLHIAAWERVVLKRLRGEPIGSIPDEENFPAAPDDSEESWQATLRDTDDVHAGLADEVAHLGEERLDEIALGADYSNRFMLYGVIQHDVYHAGQIALLKKAVTR
jgi:uncharacterized damage-inducible protein DinB